MSADRSPGGSAADETIAAASRETDRSAVDHRRPKELSRGEPVDRYIILSRIGRGAMGSVYAAFDPNLSRRVAIKVLHRGADRLAREAQALAQLSHPNVVTVHDVGVSDGRAFVAMELVEGGSLRDWLSEAPRSGKDIISMYVAAGRGVAAAHATGIVHRDFKPANVLVSKEGAVKVADFGLARASENTTGESGALASTALDLTVTGAALGTPRFMAPEIHGGRRGDEASDQFAFCVALFSALYGVHPFPHDNMPGLIGAVTLGKPEVPPNTSVPSGLRDIVLRGLRRQPSDRYKRLSDLLDDLERHLRPRWPYWAAAGGVAAAAALAVSVADSDANACDAMQRALDEVWSDARRQTVYDAISAVDLPFAERTRDDVIAGIDEYAEAWTVERAAACRTTLDPESTDRTPELRIACLERGRDALTQVIDLLAHADERTVALVPTIVAFDDPAQCSSQSSSTEMPLPEDREEAAAVLDLRGRLDHLALRWRTREDRLSRDEFDALVQEAEATDFAPIHAYALKTRGESYEETQEFGQAAKDYLLALRLATNTNYDRLAARCVAGLLTAHVESSQVVDNLDLLIAMADGYLARWPDDPYLPRRLLASSAFALSKSGHAAPASERVARLHALAIRSPSLVFHRQALSTSLTVALRAGRYAEAVGASALGISVGIAARGESHPTVARGWLDTGQAYMGLGFPVAGLEAFERVSTILAGRPSRLAARALAAESGALVRLSRYEDAYDTADAGLKMLESLKQSDNLLDAILTSAKADAADTLGRPEEAIALYERSIQIRRDLGMEATSMIPPLANLSTAYAASGMYEQAIELQQRVLALAVEHYGRRHPDTGQVRFLVGATLTDAGRHEEARRELHEAVDLMEASVDPNSPLLASAHASLARSELVLGDTAQARRLAQLAADVPDADPNTKCYAHLVLAQLESQRGDQPAAERSTAAAVSALAGDSGQTCHAAVEHWLTSRKP